MPDLIVQHLREPPAARGELVHAPDGVRVHAVALVIGPDDEVAVSVHAPVVRPRVQPQC